MRLDFVRSRARHQRGISSHGASGEAGHLPILEGSSASERILRGLSRWPCVIGPLALVWLLVRSGRKPSRLAYPCQQLAAAQAAIFFGVLYESVSRAFGRPRLLRSSPAKILAFAVISLVLVTGTSEAGRQSSPADHPLHGAMGAAAGPSRVVRIHSSRSTAWDFASLRYDQAIDQSEVYRMLDRGVMELTGLDTPETAWRSIMTGYVPGDRVAIKVNNNNAPRDNDGQVDTDQQAINAVIAGLRGIGIPETDIYVYDVSRSAIPRQRDGVLAVFPGVHFVHQGNVSWDPVPFTGSFGSVRIPTVLTGAQHLINLHMMKMHELASVTGAMKNHLGSTSSPSSFHSNIETTLSELNAYPHIRDKTRLIIDEALFGSSGCCDRPRRFTNQELFPEETPNSLILGFDPVAIDSVLYDYWIHETGGNVGPDDFLHIAADQGLGVHEHGVLGDGAYTPKDLTYQTIDYVNLSLDTPNGLPTFADVPFDHPYHGDIEALYQAGYTAGCNADPLMYCPENTMNRAESAVFVERGIHSSSYTPPSPSAQVFADLPLDSSAAGWVSGLWADQYTAGCGTNPLIYCPWQGHTRAEGSVFYLRMLNGPTFVPPPPASQTFSDVPLDAWYAGWAQAAYDAGLIQACAVTPELRFCPDEPLTRAVAAYMMVRAKELLPP